MHSDEGVKLYSLLITDKDKRREVRLTENRKTPNFKKLVQEWSNYLPSLVANKRPCSPSLEEQHKAVIQLFSFEPTTSIYRPLLPAPHGANNQSNRLVTPDQPTGTPEQPRKRRKRRTCAVCSEKDGLCGGGDKRFKCAFRCGYCQQDSCNGHYKITPCSNAQ
ncbi:hypothetical protein K501DRAFT_277983 [Backusella circina FSU 941]|nr:hypothetical protein K501DRAFT_277983 [Backusella circina FSU 941]